jgi:hypothetical protein
MGHLIFARLKGVNCPWYCVTLHTFTKATADRVVAKLDNTNWEYTAAEPETKISYGPPAKDIQ